MHHPINTPPCAKQLTKQHGETRLRLMWIFENEFCLIIHLKLFSFVSRKHKEILSDPL